MKNYRKFLVPFILIVLVAVGISNIDIESVDKHDNVSKTNTGIVAEKSKTKDKLDETGKDVSKNKSEQNKMSGKKSRAGRKQSNSNLNKTKRTKKKKKTKKKNAKKIKAKKNRKSKKSKKRTSVKNKKKLEGKTSKPKKNQNKGKKENNKKKENTPKPQKTPVPYKKDTIPTKEPDRKDEYIKCSITIDCDILLSNMDKLDKNARKYVPKDGKILDKVELKVKKGASAYDVLVTACKEKKIAYDAEYSAIYNSSYVKGIGYLYEKMAGDMSGWLYLVNGATPNVGASAYKLKDGDSIEWTYTCSGRAGS